MTRTGRAPRLGHHLAEPYVEVHPNDAQTLGVAPADLMQVTSDLGTGIFRVLMTERVQRGHLFAQMHWTRQLATSR